MMAVLGMQKSEFYRLQREGAFERFKVIPSIGRRCYSGALVERWLKGEPLYQPTFGRKVR
jgi:hypothetical protein